MKARNIAAAALMTAAGTGAVQAQSTVTLYGVADVNVEYANHVGAVPVATNQFNRGQGHDVVRMNSGGLAGSCWGIRGTEDLGGGAKAMFVLESGFSLDSGTLQQSGRMFGRQAFVGLQRAGLGQMTFGRQYTSMFEALANFSPTAYATQYEPVVLQSGANFREDNTIKYTGQFGPVHALAHWSFGTGLALPATVGVATPIGGNGECRARSGATPPTARPWPTRPARSGSPSAMTSGTRPSAPAAARCARQPSAAAAALAMPRSVAGYRWGQNKNAGGTVIQRDDLYWIGALYQLTPAVGLTLGISLRRSQEPGRRDAARQPVADRLRPTTRSPSAPDVYLTTAYAKGTPA